MTYRPQRPIAAPEARNAWEFIGMFPPETEVSNLLSSETWTNCAQYFRQYDEVKVIPQSGTFLAHLIVMDAGRTFAKMRLLSITPLNATAEEVIPRLAGLKENAAEPPAPPAALPEDAPVFVRWNPGAKKYSIYRASDKEKINDGSAVKADAIAWALSHITAMAA